MKKLILILVALAMAVYASRVSAQTPNQSSTYIANAETDSLMTDLYASFNTVSKLNNYTKVGADTIHSIPSGGFQVYEFSPGKKEFHGTYGLDKYVISRGNINYFVGGSKKFTVSDRSYLSDTYDWSFAKAKLQGLLQTVKSTIRKK